MLLSKRNSSEMHEANQFARARILVSDLSNMMQRIAISVACIYAFHLRNDSN